MRIPNVNKSRLLSYSLFASAVLVALTTAYFVFTIDVITNWSLVIPNRIIRAGDTVIIKSEYEKVRQIKGTATRYIECWTKDRILVSYPINEAVADREAGLGGTGIVMTIPTNIPDLPTQCKFRVTIEYPVLPFRHVIESNRSDTFTLLPSPDERSVSVSQSTTSTSQAQEPASNPQSRDSSSSSNTTTNPSTPQSNNPQPPINNTPPTTTPEVQENRGLVDTVITTLTAPLRAIRRIL